MIKCRRGGCGTIIEDFWRFCPACGTNVSLEDRQAVLGRQPRDPGLTEASVLSYLTITNRMLDARLNGPYSVEEAYLRDLDRIWRQLTEDQRDEVERCLIEKVLEEGSRER